MSNVKYSGGREEVYERFSKLYRDSSLEEVTKILHNRVNTLSIINVLEFESTLKYFNLFLDRCAYDNIHYYINLSNSTVERHELIINIKNDFIKFNTMSEHDIHTIALRNKVSYDVVKDVINGNYDIITGCIDSVYSTVNDIYNIYANPEYNFTTRKVHKSLGETTRFIKFMINDGLIVPGDVLMFNVGHSDNKLAILKNEIFNKNVQVIKNYCGSIDVVKALNNTVFAMDNLINEFGLASNKALQAKFHNRINFIKRTIGVDIRTKKIGTFKMYNKDDIRNVVVISNNFISIKVLKEHIINLCTNDKFIAGEKSLKSTLTKHAIFNIKDLLDIYHPEYREYDIKFRGSQGANFAYIYKPLAVEIVKYINKFIGIYKIHKSVVKSYTVLFNKSLATQQYIKPTTLVSSNLFHIVTSTVRTNVHTRYVLHGAVYKNTKGLKNLRGFYISKKELESGMVRYSTLENAIDIRLKDIEKD